MRRAAHVRSLLSLDRRDLETLWIAMWGWLQLGLRPKELPGSRLGLLQAGMDPETDVALQIAADAAAVTLIELPEAFHSNPRDAVVNLAPALDAIAVYDPEGRFESVYEQDAVSVLNLAGPQGVPVEVIGRLYSVFIRDGFLKPFRVLWEGPPSAALRSWVEATAEIPFTLVHVGGRHDIDPGFVQRLVDEGQAGQVVRTAYRPTGPALDVFEPIDILRRAATIAALFEWALGRAK